MNKISEKAQTLYTNAKLVSHFLNENVMKPILKNPVESAVLTLMAYGVIGCAAPKTTNLYSLEENRKAMTVQVDSLQAIYDGLNAPIEAKQSKRDSVMNNLEINSDRINKLTGINSGLEDRAKMLYARADSIKSDSLNIANKIKRLHKEIVNFSGDLTTEEGAEDYTKLVAEERMCENAFDSIKTYRNQAAEQIEVVAKNNATIDSLSRKASEDTLRYDQMNFELSELKDQIDDSSKILLRRLDDLNLSLEGLNRKQTSYDAMKNISSALGGLKTQNEKVKNLEYLLEEINSAMGKNNTLRDDSTRIILATLNLFDGGLENAKELYGPTFSKVKSLLDSLNGFKGKYEDFIQREKDLLRLQGIDTSGVDLSEYQKIIQNIKSITSKNSSITQKEYEGLDKGIIEGKKAFGSERDYARYLEKRIKKAGSELNSTAKDDTVFYEILGNIRNSWDGRLSELEGSIESYEKDEYKGLNKDFYKDIKAIRALVKRIDTVTGNKGKTETSCGKKPSFRLPELETIAGGMSANLSEERYGADFDMAFYFDGSRLYPFVTLGAEIVNKENSDSHTGNPMGRNGRYSVQKWNGTEEGIIYTAGFGLGVDVYRGTALEAAMEFPLNSSKYTETVNERIYNSDGTLHSPVDDYSHKSKVKQNPFAYLGGKIPLGKGFALTGGSSVGEGRKPVHRIGVTKKF